MDVLRESGTQWVSYMLWSAPLGAFSGVCTFIGPHLIRQRRIRRAFAGLRGFMGYRHQVCTCSVCQVLDSAGTRTTDMRSACNSFLCYEKTARRRPQQYVPARAGMSGSQKAVCQAETGGGSGTQSNAAPSFRAACSIGTGSSRQTICVASSFLYLLSLLF